MGPCRWPVLALETWPVSKLPSAWAEGEPEGLALTLAVSLPWACGASQTLQGRDMRCRARRPERDRRGLRSSASPISVCSWQGQSVGPDHGREGRAGLETSSITHSGTQQACLLLCDMGVAASPREAGGWWGRTPAPAWPSPGPGPPVSPPPQILAATPCLHPLPSQGPSQG